MTHWLRSTALKRQTLMNNLSGMNFDDKIYIAGHSGLVGSAISLLIWNVLLFIPVGKSLGITSCVFAWDSMSSNEFNLAYFNPYTR